MSILLAEKYFHLFVTGWTFLALLSLPMVLNRKPEKEQELDEKLKTSKTNLILPELLSIAAFTFIFLTGNSAKTSVTWLFFFFWISHFGIKIIFNTLNGHHYKTRSVNTKMFSVIVTVNALINGYYLGWLWPAYAVSWINHPAFLGGSILIILGFVIQISANIGIATNEEIDKHVLNSGLHKIVFCPAYFGEILQWGGFAIITWSAPAAAAFCWMLPMLYMQATVQKHRYLHKFPELPMARKALVPYIL